MADVISFGNNVDTSGPASMLRTIFRYIRQHAKENKELMELVAQEKEFDAQGGWFFDNLSLVAFEHLEVVLNRLSADLPNAISDWNEHFRPSFYTGFQRFQQTLAERIEQLRTELASQATKP